MERHRAWVYTVGGWRSASLEVGGTRLRQGYGAARREEDRGKIVDCGMRIADWREVKPAKLAEPRKVRKELPPPERVLSCLP